jgi:NAD-dependent SIR2 family protein deacetylase
MTASLQEFVHRHQQIVALTGAGVSAGSGIPTYRDDQGRWLRSDPIQHQEFVREAASRRRYWARSMAGWRYVEESRPNRAHHALAALEAAGHLPLLVTQNVDRLHQRAGHRSVVDLHGRLDRVRCLDCGATVDRSAYQRELEADNPEYGRHVAEIRPDGDAEVSSRFVDGLRVPPCRSCGGVLMPDVVFFGGTVPRPRVERIASAIQQADALLAVGSSLTVYSGFRFCRLARELGKPLAIVNRGRTRADDLAYLKIEADCGSVLEDLATVLKAPDGRGRSNPPGAHAADPGAGRTAPTGESRAENRK